MKEIKGGLIGLLIGMIIGYFLIPKVPDIQYKHDVIFGKAKETGTHTVTINTHTIVTGGTTATILPSGATIVAGSHLSIDTASRTASTAITVKETEYKEIYKEKIVNYSGSVYVLWSNLTYIPSVVGMSYIVFNPISLMTQYDIDEKKIKAGLSLTF